MTFPKLCFVNAPAFCVLRTFSPLEAFLHQVYQPLAGPRESPRVIADLQATKTISYGENSYFRGWTL